MTGCGAVCGCCAGCDHVCSFEKAHDGPCDWWKGAATSGNDAGTGGEHRFGSGSLGLNESGPGAALTAPVQANPESTGVDK